MSDGFTETAQNGPPARKGVSAVLRNRWVMLAGGGVAILILFIILSRRNTPSAAAVSAGTNPGGATGNNAQNPGGSVNTVDAGFLANTVDMVSTQSQAILNAIKAITPTSTPTDGPIPVSRPLPGPWQHGDVPQAPPGYTVVARPNPNLDNSQWDVPIATPGQPFNPSGPSYWKPGSPEASNWAWRLQPAGGGGPWRDAYKRVMEPVNEGGGTGGGAAANGHGGFLWGLRATPGTRLVSTEMMRVRNTG